MKKATLWMSALLLAIAGLSSCSNDDLPDLSGMFGEDYAQLLEPLYAIEDIRWSGSPHYEQMGNWGVSIDDEGHYRGANFYGTYEPLDKLYAAPSSIEELNGIFFDQNKDYEWRLDSIKEIPIWEGMPTFTRFLEFYTEYYKDVPVYQGKLECFYYGTDQGHRMINCQLRFATFDNLDVTPVLTPEQALQIFATYQQAPVEDTWQCKLYVREYNLQSDGVKTGTDHRLIYEVIGPPALHFLDWGLYDMSAHYKAEIDAHTGQIIVAGNDDNF